MQLPVMTFTGLLEQMAAGLQAAATPLVDLTVGSVLRAILESCASVILWLQWLILQVLARTRASTSVGPDLDSWMADFSFSRLPGVAADGAVTFGRYTPGLAAIVNVGTTVLTTDGSQSFVVIKDENNDAWNGARGYTLPAGLASADIPVQCTTSGPAGNVQPLTIGLLSSPVAGIDTISNAAALSGGVDDETDALFRQRFQLYINSRSLATRTAILYAVASVQLGLRCVVTENVDTQLNFAPGNFLVVVDNGTGTPGTTLLANVQAAVETVRPIGSIFSVQGPLIIEASVVVTLETSSAQTRATVAAAVQSDIMGWIAGLPIAGTLAVSKIDALAHAADSSVVSVLSTLINGISADLVAPTNGVILPTNVTVS